jgi:hypothetical protein
MQYWKGDFLKISDISLGYSLSKQVVNKLNIQKIRLYVKVQNPFMFTKFEGNDPEGSISSQRSKSNGKITAYNDASFTMRNYMLGLNVTF